MALGRRGRRAGTAPGAGADAAGDGARTAVVRGEVVQVQRAGGGCGVVMRRRRRMVVVVVQGTLDIELRTNTQLAQPKWQGCRTTK